MSDRAFLSRVICLIVAAHSRIQMLVRCILVRGCRRVRQARDVGLSVAILTVPDHLPLHAHARVMRVQLASRVCGGLDTLPHLEERVHLLLGADLVAEDAVGPQIAWLMDV